MRKDVPSCKGPCYNFSWISDLCASFIPLPSPSQLAHKPWSNLIDVWLDALTACLEVQVKVTEEKFDTFSVWIELKNLPFGKKIDSTSNYLAEAATCSGLSALYKRHNTFK